MRCHECTANAAYAARAGNVRVGLCERHLRQRMEQLPEDAAITALKRAIRD